jgi:hypothetical protein
MYGIARSIDRLIGAEKQTVAARDVDGAYDLILPAAGGGLDYQAGLADQIGRDIKAYQSSAVGIGLTGKDNIGYPLRAANPHNDLGALDRFRLFRVAYYHS